MERVAWPTRMGKRTHRVCTDGLVLFRAFFVQPVVSRAGTWGCRNGRSWCARGSRNVAAVNGGGQPRRRGAIQCISRQRTARTVLGVGGARAVKSCEQQRWITPSLSVTTVDGGQRAQAKRFCEAKRKPLLCNCHEGHGAVLLTGRGLGLI